jgi:hypothetical protein
MEYNITQYSELQLIPEIYRNAGLCKEMINKHIYNIIFVPDSVLEPDMFNTRDNYLKKIFKYVPDEYKTQNMCNNAVNLDTLNLEFVPDEYKTVGLINSAYATDKKIIKFIPKEQITYEMYLESTCACNSFLDMIPEEFKTKQIFQEVASKTSKTLEEFLTLIPENIKANIIDEDLYISWLKSTTMAAFDQIPTEIKIESFYVKCLMFSVKTLCYMPEEMFNPVTMKIEEAADFYSKFAIIPSSYVTPALQTAYDSTSDLWIGRLKNSGYKRDVFEAIPSQYKNNELIYKMFAFKKDNFD